MNAESSIRELVKECLDDSHNVRGVEFIDQLLPLASETGEIACTLASDCKLRFEIPGLPAWEVELERAKAKLRMLCARLSVLCNENAHQDVSIYGGEGVIDRQRDSVPASSSLKLEETSSWRSPTVNGPSTNALRSSWKVRFQNTPGKQEFTIQAQ